MDLNKEREAFEASGICTKSMFDNVMWDQWQFKYVPLVREKKICDNAIKINDRFLGWKAAKSQVPEGFVLVSKEPTHDMMVAALAVIATGIGKKHIDMEITKCWEKMIEASQEPDHD